MRGLTVRSQSSEEEVRLPWWPSLRTSARSRGGLDPSAEGRQRRGSCHLLRTKLGRACRENPRSHSGAMSAHQRVDDEIIPHAKVRIPLPMRDSAVGVAYPGRINVRLSPMQVSLRTRCRSMQGHPFVKESMVAPSFVARCHEHDAAPRRQEAQPSSPERLWACTTSF